MTSTTIVARQLAKEFWLPVCLAACWTVYGLANQPFENWLSIKTVNSAIVTFFSFSFFSAQWNRVKKQVEVKQGLVGIEDKIKGMLITLEEKTNKLADHITGGDSYCFLLVTPEGHATFTAVGAYPLYDLGVIIIDQQKLKQEKRPGVDALAQATEWLQLGTMRPNAFFSWPRRFFLGGEEVHHFDVQFHARNGIFSQPIQFRNVGGTWMVATKIIRFDASLTTLHEMVDANFPRGPDGQVDWNYGK